MSKNIIYGAVFILLLIISGIILLKRNTDSGDWEKDFAVENVQQINKIILTDKIKGTAMLSRSNDKEWMINEKYPARIAAVNTLLKTLKDIRVEYPVPQSAHNNVVRELIAESVKVEVFVSGKEKPAKVMLVGGSARGGNGTFFIMQKHGKIADRPYVLNLPNFTGYLSGRFFVDEESWRSKEIIHINKESIKEVKIEYPSFPDNSFKIQKVDSQYEIAPISIDPIQQQADQRLLDFYLQQFKSISVETYHNNFSGKDSVIQNQPFCLMTIVDEDGSINEITIYYKPVSKRSKYQTDALGNKMDYDVDRFYASVNNHEDFAIIQYYVFGKLLRSYQDFFPQNMEN